MADAFQITDVHAHLDARQFAADLSAVMDRAAQAGVSRIVTSGTDLESSRRCVELARRMPRRVYATVGVHPNDWFRSGPDDMRQLERLVGQPEVVAIGETGLDLHRKTTQLEQQLDAFRQHIRLALWMNKPLIVHAHKSDEEVLRVLAESDARLSGLRHCFDRAPQIAERYVELGFYISFGGLVTRSGFKKVKHAARTVPDERLLVETDSPYQAPASRAGARNEPAFIVDTVRALAELRGTTPEQIAAITAENAARLLFRNE